MKDIAMTMKKMIVNNNATRVANEWHALLRKIKYKEIIISPCV